MNWESSRVTRSTSPWRTTGCAWRPCERKLRFVVLWLVTGSSRCSKPTAAKSATADRLSRLLGGPAMAGRCRTGRQPRRRRAGPATGDELDQSGGGGLHRRAGGGSRSIPPRRPGPPAPPQLGPSLRTKSPRSGPHQSSLSHGLCRRIRCRHRGCSSSDVVDRRPGDSACPRRLGCRGPSRLTAHQSSPTAPIRPFGAPDPSRRTSLPSRWPTAQVGWWHRWRWRSHRPR